VCQAQLTGCSTYRSYRVNSDDIGITGDNVPRFSHICVWLPQSNIRSEDVLISDFITYKHKYRQYHIDNILSVFAIHIVFSFSGRTKFAPLVTSVSCLLQIQSFYDFEYIVDKAPDRQTGGMQRLT